MWPTELRFLRQPDITQRLIFAQARGQMLRKIPLSQTCGCLRKQSCAYTLTESIEKLIFHSISNLVQIQELKKCHNHTSLGQNYSLREFLSCIHTKSKTPHGVCVWLGIPPTTGICNLTFLPLKDTSALSAPVALYTPYTPLSHRRGHQIISSPVVMFIMHQPERAKQLTWETVPWDLAAISFQAATSKSLTHLPGGL